MDVIGNNIANVNTTAFKGSTVTFRDVYYQTRQRASGGDFTAGGVNPMQTGLGVQLGTVSKVMTQSGITFSDSAFDLALEGSGFFQVQDPMGNIFYTRLGRFSLDDFGNLVDPNGNIVLGVTGDPTNIAASSQRINIQIPDIQDAQAQALSVFRASDGQDHNIIIRAGSDGPGGNIALTIVPSDFPFATMTGSTLNVFMDLTKDYEALAIRDILAATNLPGSAGVFANTPQVFLDATGLPDPANAPAAPSVYRLTDAQAAVISVAQGLPATGVGSVPPGIPVTFEHIALFNQAVIERVSDMFSEDIAEAIRLGGVNIDPALDGLSVEFVTTPRITAAQSASNFFQTPGTGAASMGGMPVANTTNTLNETQINALNAAGFTPAIPTTGTTVITAAHVTAFQAIIDRSYLNFEVNRPGAAGNNIRIDMITSSTPGFLVPTATWNNNVLTVTVPNSGATVGQIQAAIDQAAAGREDRMITVTNGNGIGGSPPTIGQPLTDLQLAVLGRGSTASTPPVAPAVIPQGTIATDAHFNNFNAIVRASDVMVDTSGISSDRGNRIGMNRGSNSFFEDAFSRLGTMPLTGGAFQTAQTADTADIFIDRDGVIYGMHPVHGQIILGRVDIVEFVNPAGLAQVGTSYFVETLASGPAQVRLARNESDTQIISGALEMSNIDLSQEFSDMIITQRGFQANSRIITVSDSMLEELVNLKR
jgi:flagellar hook-basal body protein